MARVPQYYDYLGIFRFRVLVVLLVRMVFFRMVWTTYQSLLIVLQTLAMTVRALHLNIQYILTMICVMSLHKRRILQTTKRNSYGKCISTLSPLHWFFWLFFFQGKLGCNSKISSSLMVCVLPFLRCGMLSCLGASPDYCMV